jgi:hypothetical protein
MGVRWPLEPAEEPDQPGDDQVDGNDVIEQARNDQDQDACDQRNRFFSLVDS